jgi:hypothetical protein
MAPIRMTTPIYTRKQDGWKMHLDVATKHLQHYLGGGGGLGGLSCLLVQEVKDETTLI